MRNRSSPAGRLWFSSPPCYRAVFSILRPLIQGILNQHLASLQGLTGVLTELLKQTDIEVEKRDSEGRTALHHAVQANRHACVSLLIDHAVDINAQDHAGQPFSFFYSFLLDFL
jgi:ankyrin repeat protein